jgi:hypothetical protein
MSDIYKITVNGQEKELTVKVPGGADYNEADKIRSKTLYEALKEGLPTIAELEQILVQKKIWNDEKGKQAKELRTKIADKEYELSRGNMKLSHGKELALEIKNLRNELRNLLLERSMYFNKSVEGYAENMHFNCLVSRCLVYNNTKEPYYKDLNDYNNDNDTEVALWAAYKLANMLHGIGKDSEKNLVENEFLLKFGFVNEDLQLVDKDKNLVDEEGNKVDQFGNRIDENGNLIDMGGHPRGIDGSLIIEKQPFLDEDGSPIVDDVNLEANDLSETQKQEDSKLADSVESA